MSQMVDGFLHFRFSVLGTVILRHIVYVTLKITSILVLANFCLNLNFALFLDRELHRGLLAKMNTVKHQIYRSKIRTES